MSLKLKNLKRGFTLVELMIVVAIVGILAALAVYGVTKYVKNAKTAEARDALGRMAKDAVAAFQKEGMAADVMTMGGTTTVANRLCGDAALTPGTAPAGAKYQSQPSDWNQGSKDLGWQCLKFSMNEPQYFAYNYDLDGDNFTAIAKGDLDGDGSTSDFTMAGGVRTGAGTGATERIATYAPTINEVNPDE